MNHRDVVPKRLRRPLIQVAPDSLHGAIWSEEGNGSKGPPQVMVTPHEFIQRIGWLTRPGSQPGLDPQAAAAHPHRFLWWRPAGRYPI